MTDLHLLGRDAAEFRRAVEAHGHTSPAGPVASTWVGLRELERTLLGEPGRSPGTPRSAALPDVVLVPADWLPALAAAGTIRDLSPLLAAEPPRGWPGSWPAAFRDGVSWDERVWGLPFHDGPQLLHLRRDLYAADVHGGPLEPPRTWTEFADHARRFTRDGRFGTVLAGAPDGHNNVYDLVLHLWRHGGDVTALDSDATRETLALLHEWTRTVIDPAAHGWDSLASGQEFAAGRAALTVNWAGYAATSAAAGLDAVCLPVPTADDGTPTTTVAAFWALAITTSCPVPERAWAHLRHAASPSSDLATTRAGASGCRRETWSDADVLAAHPEYALFDDAHRRSRPLPRVPALPRIVDELSALVDDVVWRGAPPDPAVARTAAAIDHLLS